MDRTGSEGDDERRIRDVVAIAGLGALGVGLVLLAPTELGFDRAKVIEALITWVPVTVPPALLVLAVTALELLTGLVLARSLLGRPIRDLTEALLAGFAGAVVKSVVLLGLLAGFGLFIAPVLVAADVLVLAAWLWWRRRIGGGPALVATGLRLDIRPTPFTALVTVVWLAPIVILLGAPVAPFLDILPNHVAPAEHLRAFGSIDRLTDTWSPIYGPSRTLLGYTAMLGAVTTISGLPAGAALAGFVLPSTLLVATGVRHLARTVGGPGLVGWALLAFAASTSVARLGDARATVVVLPLVALVLAAVAGAGMPAGPRGAVALAFALGAAILVHPVIGALTALVVAVVTLLSLGRAIATATLLGGLAGAAVIALPQFATMLGIALPPITLLLALGAGGVAASAVAAGASRVARQLPVVPRADLATRDPGVAGLLPRAVPIAVVAAAVAIAFMRPFGDAAHDGLEALFGALEVAMLLALVAVARASATARSPVVVAAIVVGAVVAVIARLVPEEGTGLLGDALRFELPKTLHYWAPLPMALLAAGGLAALTRLAGRIARPTGIGVAAIAIIMLAVPLRPTPIDAIHLGEYRWSETLSIALGELQRGYWRGFPDTRYVVDGPRREIVEVIRDEIAAGRIGATMPVLHVAASFQQWTATPLGPFAGVTETIVSGDAVVNIHTVGGRLHPFEELDRLLASGDHAVVVLEPEGDDVPPDARDRILAAGYVSFWSNEQGELFRAGG